MRVCGTFFLAVSTLPVAALAVDGGGHQHNVTNIPIMLRYADGASIEVNFIPGDTVEGVAADVCVKELKGVVDIDVCCRMITRLLMHEVVRSGLVDLRVGSTGQPPPPDPTAAVWTPGPQPAHGTFLADPMQLADVAARVRDDYRYVLSKALPWSRPDTHMHVHTYTHLFLQREAAVSSLGDGRGV